MKKLMFLLLSLLILQLYFSECRGQYTSVVNADSQSLSAEDVDAILKKGKKLFEDAYYEDAAGEFLVIVHSGDAPPEDRIKAHYFLMRIYRAYGEDEKVKNEITEILNLNPYYMPSSREPASVKKLFKEIREEFLKKHGIKEKTAEIALPSVLMEDIAVLERSLTQVSYCQDSFSLKVDKVENEFKKLRLTFYVTSLTLFLLLAAGIGFK